jgi:Short C-terminal domain
MPQGRRSRGHRHTFSSWRSGSPETRPPTKLVVGDILHSVPGRSPNRARRRVCYAFGKPAQWERSQVRVAAEGTDQIQRRVTVTRMLAVGLLALGWRKEEKRSFLVIESAGAEVISRFDDLSVHELRAKLPGARLSSPAVLDDGPGASDQFVGQLERLASLRNSGALSETEFQAAKSKLLDL